MPKQKRWDKARLLVVGLCATSSLHILWALPCFIVGCGQYVSTQLEVPPHYSSIFEIDEIDVGDEAWGQNILRAKIKNITDKAEPFWLHIGGEYVHSGYPQGFGMGMLESTIIEPKEEHLVQHMYWIPPQVGDLSYTVKCVVPDGESPPWEQEPFFTKAYTVTYETPNHECNELTPPPQFLKHDWLKKYRDGATIPPFQVISAEHFVFYVLPDSPAMREIEVIRKERERVMKEICAFLGVSFDQPVNFFFYPDALSKRWCTIHQGDGLAYGTTIVEIYNDQTRVDPAHELTHIVASQLGDSPALLNEGLAVYMQDGHKWEDEHVDITAAKLLDEKRLVPLAELILREEIGSRPDDGEVAYPQSASFVKFIIDRYGRERFLELYATLKTGAEDNVSRFQDVLGVELKVLEQEWWKVLSEIEY